MFKLIQILIILTIIAFSCNTPKAIKSDLQSNTYQYETSQIETDIFGNIYTLDKNELTKLTPALDTLSSFTFPSVDQINNIDLLNPNEIVAFSESAQVIYILDNLLGLISSINLNETDLGYVVGICRTRDDLINVLSRDQKKLFGINELGKINSMSDVLWNIDLSEALDLVQIDNYIAIRSRKDKTVWLYDEFGTLHSQILDVQTEYKLQAYKGLLVYLSKSNQLVFKSLERLVDEPQYKNVEFDQSMINSIHLYENHIYLLMKSGVVKKEIIQS